MRLCPSVEGSPSPLITHRIGVDVCMARQRTFFHKCHRCIYRGQAATWEPAEAPLAMVNVHAAEEPAQAGVKVVEIPGPAAKPGRRSAKPAAGKAAAAANKGTTGA
jgi:hypothetical protein